LTVITVGAKSSRKPKGAGGERRAEILAAAEQIFLTAGYEGATIRKIADEVGVSPTALYMHFPDKHAMLMAIGEEALDEVLAQSEAIAAEDTDAKDRVTRVLMAHMQFALKNKTAYEVVFCDGARAISKHKTRTRELCNQYYRVVSDLIVELGKAGRLKQPSAHAVAQVMWFGCHGLVTYLITNPGFGYVEVDELMQTMVDGLVGGLID
jgi:AcrR family transcriptional regulator